jgi:hypothetical protein
MSSPYYFRLKPALIWTVLYESSASTRMALASSAALKVTDMEGMVGWAEEGCALRYNSFSSVAVAVTTTTVAASWMLSCS